MNHLSGLTYQQLVYLDRAIGEAIAARVQDLAVLQRQVEDQMEHLLFDTREASDAS